MTRSNAPRAETPRPETPRPETPRREPPRRAGFTLVELLVAATLLVIVGATLGSMLAGQFRIFNRTQSAVRVQRDLRTGLGLLPLDLRGASRAAGDLTELRDTLIELRATIGTSVLCERPNAFVVDLPPLGMARNALTVWYAQPSTGDRLLVYNDSTSPGPEDDVWTDLPILSVDAAPLAACAGAPYTDPALDPPATKRRWRVVLAGTLPPGARPGAPIRFLRPVRYSLFRPAGGTHWYLGYRERTLAGWSTAEAIAGPFDAPGGTQPGLRFAYFDTLGAPLGTPANGSAVGRVDILLRAADRIRGGTDSIVVRDSVAVRIALRNRL